MIHFQSTKLIDPKQDDCHVLAAIRLERDWIGGGVCSICGRALPSRELSDLNYKSWTLAFSSCAHKFRLYTSLLRLSFARKGVGKSRCVCCFNKTLKVLLFRLHFVFYQSYCRGLLCRLVPALTSLAIRNTTMAVFVGGRECTGGCEVVQRKERIAIAQTLVSYP